MIRSLNVDAAPYPKTTLLPTTSSRDEKLTVMDFRRPSLSNQKSGAYHADLGLR